MNQAIKERWIAALRSGDYKQGFGSLRNGDAFCCLGVLCQLAVDEGVASFDGASYDGNDATLPQAVIDWAGLTNGNPETEWLNDNPAVKRPDGTTETLGGLNDEGDTTFPQLADLIDQQL